METQVFPFVIMRPCHFGCSGLCVGARKVETNSVIFAQTLQLSGEGDLLAIAQRHRRKARLPFQHLKGCSGATFCCSQKLSRDVRSLVRDLMSHDGSCFVERRSSIVKDVYEVSIQSEPSIKCTDEDLNLVLSLPPNYPPRATKA